MLKRVYEPPSVNDGWRVLVDRIWPRGLSKEKVHLDAWCKDIAPSAELRQWFNHEVDKWPEFVEKYQNELDVHHDIVQTFLASIKDHEIISLLYAAHDEEHNNALVLKNYIEQLST